MNPFYEKRSGKLQIGVSDNMNFPAHLHDDVEVLYCLEGGVQVSVMGETHLVGKGMRRDFSGTGAQLSFGG